MNLNSKYNHINRRISRRFPGEISEIGGYKQSGEIKNQLLNYSSKRRQEGCETKPPSNKHSSYGLVLPSPQEDTGAIDPSSNMSIHLQ